MIDIVHLTDLHVAAEPGDLHGRDPERTLRAVLDDIERGPAPDLVVATGDLAHDGSAPAYERLGVLLDGAFEAPVYCLAGNHDHEDPLSVHLPRRGVHREATCRIDDWLLVFVDSNANGRVWQGHRRVDVADRHLQAAVPGIEADDLRWLDGVLTAASAPNVLVLAHHPPLGPAAHPDVVPEGYRSELCAVLDRHPEVRGLAAGHLHFGYEARRGSATVFVAPSTWLAMDLDAMTSMPPGYRRLRLHPDGAIETEVVHVADPAYGEREPLPQWAADVVAGNLDPSQFAGMSQEEVIAEFANRG